MHEIGCSGWEPDHWVFIVPVVIAFLVSFIHGAFTDAFWRFLGITRKTDTNSHPAASSQPSHAA
jgi:hypothetical protein